MGLTVIDAGVIIGFLDANDSHHLEAHAALDDARSRNDRLVLPASAFAEVLVGPSRRGPAAVAAVRGLVERVPIDVEPLDLEIAMLAAAVRARHRSIKLPDALVIATASHIDADHLITTDRNGRRGPRSSCGLRSARSDELTGRRPRRHRPIGPRTSLPTMPASAGIGRFSAAVARA
ncbi:MAG: PIN domain-containing protein [Actinobacteria bacterium]|nr:PIN domain-containing protein [Actinomycetota bacterium]